MAKRRQPYHVPERFLRQLWQHRQFQSTQLETTGGRRIEVHSPGVLNRDGGPDFIDASIRIGGVLYRGDVELHQHASEWNDHGHHLDKKYNAVILHVVLHDGSSPEDPTTESGRSIPVFLLGKFLNASFNSTWEGIIMNERTDRTHSIKCYSCNNTIEAAIIKQWLAKLAVERIELKVRRFEERLKELVDQQKLAVRETPPKYDEIPFGMNPEDLPPPVSQHTQHDFSKTSLWQQALYEGAMESLGYSKNQQPFLQMARNLPLNTLNSIIESDRGNEENILSLESVLFTVAGLLPKMKNVGGVESKRRIRAFRTKWKHLQKYYHGEMLNEAVWQFFRLRPENFPTVRLAGAARLVLKFLQENAFRSIIQTVKAGDQSAKGKYSLLESFFIIKADTFWSAHYRFEERAKNSLQTLIGKQRADDIILNTVVPLCILYARTFKDKEVRSAILEIFEECSPLAENAITRTIDRQLLKNKLSLDSAMFQQGAIQLYKRYCLEENCSECAVGKIVFKP